MTTDSTYEVIATRYRPKKLSELVGQDTVIQTVRGMLRSKKINRTIMVSGPFGLGKTTTARLIAMALNCEKAVDGDPCGVCRSCVEIINEAQNSAVQEINGANARKVEDARELIQNSKYAPRGAKYRIYILDEVHQFTPEAFKALLKVMERPPPSTVFILCTTEPAKMPPEVRSRMLKLTVRPVGPELCAKLLKRIAKQEGTPISGAVALKMARATRGHVRDAMNLLEAFLNALAGQSEAEVDLDALLEDLLGDASDGMASAFVLHVAAGETKEALTLLGKVYNHQVFCESVVRLAAHVVRQTVGDLRDAHLGDFYDEVGGIQDFSILKAVDQLTIWNEAAARVKSFQTNDPYAVMVEATCRACAVK